MSWGLVAVGVGSAVIGSDASRKANNKQQDATAAALAEQQRQFDLIRGDQAPYREAGVDALGRLSGRAGFDPTPNAEAVMAEPGYQFGLRSGLDATQGTAAARGGLYSGNALKALTRYGNDYATTKYGDAFNRAQSSFGNRWNRDAALAGIGQTANQQSLIGGVNFANRSGDLLTGGGNAAGANALAQGSIWGNALGQLGGRAAGADWGGLQGRFSNTSLGGSGFGSGLAYGNEDMGQYFADGGRVEPRVGTRSPLPQGAGGGGLSVDAIRRALDAAQTAAQQPQQRSDVGALPADPLRNPGAILRAREQRANYAAGGPVMGANPGRADNVPAMLSEGEHVLDAETVALLGDGNSAAGHALLEELKERVRAQAEARRGASNAG